MDTSCSKSVPLTGPCRKPAQVAYGLPLIIHCLPYPKTSINRNEGLEHGLKAPELQPGKPYIVQYKVIS